MTRQYIRPALYKKQQDAFFNNKRYSLVEGSTKSGKAQPLDALISTPQGWVTMGSIKEGDVVHTPRGTAIVIGLFPQGQQDVYKITFSNGSTTTATKDHLWEVRRVYRGKNPGCYIKKDIFTTEQLTELSKDHFGRSYVPQQEAVDYNLQEVPLDPYLLGFLLGDGCFRRKSLSFSTSDKEILKRIQNTLDSNYSAKHTENYDYRIKKESGYKNHYIGVITELGLWNKFSDEKFIPSCYKYNSKEIRLEIIRGLFDADASVDSLGQAQFEQTSKQLAKDVKQIVESLGGVCSTNIKLINGYKNKDNITKWLFIQGKTVYRTRIGFKDCSELFWLKRKKDKCRIKTKPLKKTFRSIELIGQEECQCISINCENKLYLTDGFIATHNTVSSAAWIVEQALIHGGIGKNYWWVAPVYPQAKIAYTRIKNGLPKDVFRANESELRLTTSNGSIIWFKSGEKPDNLYGEDVHGAVIDEASRVREESWHAVRSTLTATKAPIRIIGNVKGKLNWFYKLCRIAQAGDPDMYYAKITAYDAIEAGVLDPKEINDAKKLLPDYVFKELYLAEPNDDGSNPFGISAINNCIKPLSKLPPVVFGIDLAKSLDWTVVIGLDKNGNTCVFKRFQGSWESTIVRIKIIVGRVKAYVDSTGVGDPILEALQKGVGSNYIGYKFTSSSKQILMEGLAVAIQRTQVGFPEKIIKNELELFEYEYTRIGVRYSAPEGAHDDTVCGLALAVYGVSQRSTLDYSYLADQ